MNLPFVFRRDIHVVSVQILQIGIRIAGSTEALAFKFDFSEREHGVFAVHDAVSVVDQDIRQVGVFGINGRKYAPYCAEQMIFRTEPKELDERAQGIIMRFMQNGVAGRDTFAQFLYPFFRQTGIIDERKYIDIQPFLIVCLKVVSAFQIQ